MQYKRKMGVDYGDKRIGVALTDALCIISSAFEVFENKGEEDALKHLQDVIKQYSVDEIAFGLPFNMDGSIGERAKIHESFGKKLENLSGCKVHFIDERLTSSEADEILKSSGMRWEERKKHIDKLSAQIILQTFLNGYKKGK